MYVQTTEQCRASSKIMTPHPLFSLHPASVSSPRTKGGGGGTHSPGGEGVGGQYFGRRQTWIGLLEYNPSTPSTFPLVHQLVVHVRSNALVYPVF
jgi:hypothetical protein